MDRRRTLIAVVITAMFVLPILQFGFLQSWRDGLVGPLANDGSQASFFVLHARPFYVIPEDFHLYVVRAKRIAERGWSGDLLWGRDVVASQTVATAPLQVGLGYIAYLTGGEPLRYTLFLMTLLFVSWTAFVLIALNELRTFFGYAAVLAFSLVVAICEIPTSIVTLFAGYVPQLSTWSADKIWPAYKTLRFSTHGWSMPLFVALAIMAARLARNNRASWSSIGIIGGILTLFALGDVWSMLLSIGVLGFASLLHVGRRLQVAIQRDSEIENALTPTLLDKKTLVLAGVSLVAILIFVALPGSMKGDALARAGFGPWWYDSAGRVGGPSDITTGRFVIVVAVFSAMTLLTSYIRRREATMIAVLVGGLPLLAGFFLSVMLWAYGVDSWQLNQFHDRAYAAVFFSILLQGWILFRCLFVFRSESFFAKRVRLIHAARLISIFLAVFFLCHAGRTYIYIARVAASDYALTKDLEALRTTLIQLDREHKNASLATMSHEVNYLAALWTDFDLVLPEGFPLQFSGSNQAIADRMAALLRFYGATKDNWVRFNLRRTPADQVDWLQSRVLSAREGYGYYLFHRQDAYVACGESCGDYDALINIALSSGSKELLLQPDIVIIDPTSSAIGRPNLDSYELVSQLPSIEVWRHSR